ncbi:YTH domain-containing protein ECT4 isoform X2 [Mangifera indica]|uniref:YTH domain-containing protein ECT4 isoform X2 n=1 Tax=Mangifera indica TaxID=29780 RepID=UPI001CFBAF8B|nr:YTH domain-containing protein ECT4 isoform X2 [Mangifera indica]
MDTPLDRIVSTGERPVHSNNLTEQLLSTEDERIVSANPSPDAAVIGPPKDVNEKPESSESGELGTVHSLHTYASDQQNLLYGGYGNITTTSDRYSQYANADRLHVSPVIYNDNTSLMFHPVYGYNPEMAYGQYSPVATPLSSIMVEGQLYSPHQIPFSPTYYPQAGLPNVPAIPVSPSELMTTESSADNLLFGSGSRYFVPFGGSFGGGNVSGNHGSSSLTTPAAYPQPIGILGSYEQNVGQISQQGAFNGFGLMPSSSPGGYPHGIPYQNSYFGGNDRMRPTLDKGRRRERDQESICISNDSHGIDRNRGPRFSKVKGKGTSEQSSSSSNSKNNFTGLQINLELYNQPDFVTEYENAKFFIIKSFSEDNIHKSIKHNVWASTPHGNKKLDAAYHEANKTSGSFPIFLLFSVNASGHFCGVAEMAGPVDFEKDADYWQQDRWSGQFPVKWHIIKDVPNNRFRHLLLENNDNKPVTHSRDSQEVKLEWGIEMLKIFKEHDARTCILEDFDFYDERERSLKERRARQQLSIMQDDPDLVTENSVNQISDSFAQVLQLENIPKEALNHVGVILRTESTDASVSLAIDPLNQTSDSFSVAVQSENRNKERSAAETGGQHQN